MLLGIDIGGTNFKYAISNLDNLEINTHSIKIEPNSSKQFILNKIDELLELNSNIKSIGIGIPGIINTDGTIKILPNLPNWENYNLKKYLNDKYNIPIYIDNDANIAAIAELYEGKGREFNNFVFITLGTGVGGAIIIDKKIYRGDSNSSGEIGHLIIDKNQTFQSNKNKFRQGIVEEIVGRKAILNYASKQKNKYLGSKLSKLDNYDVKEISIFAEQGDELCLEIIKYTAYNLALAIISTLTLLDIHTVIIGGGISQSSILLNEIEKVVKDRSLPNITENFRLLNARFSSNSGVIGALIAAKYLY